jgi:Arc/MetJ-type ribon-helix-helix transcriptional regulator
MARHRNMHSFYLDPEMSAGLKVIKDRDGISESEQVRRALRLWLDSKGLKLKRSVARKRGKRR